MTDRTLASHELICPGQDFRCCLWPQMFKGPFGTSPSSPSSQARRTNRSNSIRFNLELVFMSRSHGFLRTQLTSQFSRNTCTSSSNSSSRGGSSCQVRPDAIEPAREQHGGIQDNGNKNSNWDQPVCFIWK